MKAQAKNMLASHYKTWLRTKPNNIYSVYGRCSQAKIDSYETLESSFWYDYKGGHHSKITSHKTFNYTLSTTACKLDDNNNETWYFIVNTASSTYMCGLDPVNERLYDLETGEIFYED